MHHKTKNNTIKVGDLKIKFETINARSLGVKISESVTFGVNNDGKISTLVYNDFFIDLKDTIEVSIKNLNTVYTVNRFVMNQGDLNGYDFVIDQEVLNKSVYYILPVLGRDKNFYNVRYKLLNCYVSEDHNHIMLKYRFSNVPSFIDMDRKLRTHPLFRKTIQPDYYSMVYSFKIPEEFKKDVILILNGKYSKVSTNFKNKIINFSDPVTTDFFTKVLNKDTKLKKILEKELGVPIPEDVDLDSKPNKQLEIWNNV